MSQIAARKKRKRRRMSNAGMLVIFVALLFTVLLIYGVVRLLTSPSGHKEPVESTVLLETETETLPPTEPPTDPPTEPPTEPPPLVEIAVADVATRQLNEQLDAQYAVLIDCDNHKILAQKNSDVRMYPASMTKLMTIIVAIENTENFQDTFELPEEVLESCWEQNASMAGFWAGEPVTVMDMLYGAALPSGADATIGLATYVSGSEEKFVKLMNQKVKELGLENTHFVNTSGLHDENH